MKHDNFHIFLIRIIVALTAGVIAFAPGRIRGQGLVLASNYDGTNHDLSTHCVGSFTGYVFAWGASFTVAGAGDFNLTQVIMPLELVSGNPNPTNYQVSVVNDVSGQPVGSVVGSFTPGNIGSVDANFTFSITGLVQGGANYWLLFSPIAPDSGCIGWDFSYAPQYPGIGYLAERASSTGVPTGPWTISTGSGSVQPGFLIEGTAVPEPGGRVLLSLGMGGLLVYGCMRRKKV